MEGCWASCFILSRVVDGLIDSTDRYAGDTYITRFNDI